MDDADFNGFCSRLSASKSVFLNKSKFVHCAVIVPFVVIDGLYHLLFEKRALGIKQPEDICFPGGVVDGCDENVVGAGLREMREELGIDTPDVRVVGKLGVVFSFSGVMVEPVVCLLDERCLNTLVPNPREVAEWFCLPVELFENQVAGEYAVQVELVPEYVDSKGEKHILLPACELGLASKYHAPWLGARTAVWTYKTPKGTVWGITAEIIRGVLEALDVRMGK